MEAEFLLEELIRLFKEEDINIEKPKLETRPEDHMFDFDLNGVCIDFEEAFFKKEKGKIVINEKYLEKKGRLIRLISHGLGHTALHQSCDFYHSNILNNEERLYFSEGLALEFENYGLRISRKKRILGLGEYSKEKITGLLYRYNELAEYVLGRKLIKHIVEKRNASLKELVENPIKFKEEISEFIGNL